MEELSLSIAGRRTRKRDWELDEIMRMPPRIRRRMCLSRRKPRRRFIRRKFSPEELVDYLKQKDIHSVGQLEAISAEGEPRFNDYRKAFGKWSLACRKAFGVPISCEPQDIAYYLIKCACEFELWTKRAWIAAHKRQPNIIPSDMRIRTNFGKWSNLKVLAGRYSFRRTMQEYLKLTRMLGRCPTEAECKNAQIDLCRAKELFDGKMGFDEYISGLIRVESNSNARQTGNS